MTKEIILGTSMKSFNNKRDEILTWLSIIKNMSTPAGASLEEQSQDAFLGEVLRYAQVPQKLVELLHYITTDKKLTQMTLLTIRQMLSRNDKFSQELRRVFNEQTDIVNMCD